MRVYRLQPKGLGIEGHSSEDSNGGVQSGVIFVFTDTQLVFFLDGDLSFYGDELIEIEVDGDEVWPSQDVEGDLCRTENAEIVGRYTPDQFAEAFYPGDIEELKIAAQEWEGVEWPLYLAAKDGDWSSL